MKQSVGTVTAPSSRRQGGPSRVSYSLERLGCDEMVRERRGDVIVELP